MSFDAGQFFNNLFNNVGKIGKVNSENEIKLKYNPEIANDAKILPDETPDEKVIVSEKMLMYAVPDFDITVEKYAIVRPDPTIEEPVVKPDKPGVYKYAVPSVTPTAETPTPTIKPDIPKYGIPEPEPEPVPSPEPTGETPTPTIKPDIPKYGIPEPEPVPSPEPTGVAPVLKYAMPSPEPMPVPTQPTYTPTPQPYVPHNPVNPWRINIPQIISNLFGNNGSSFAQRVNNAFANFFSRLR